MKLYFSYDYAKRLKSASGDNIVDFVNRNAVTNDYDY